MSSLADTKSRVPDVVLTVMFGVAFGLAGVIPWWLFAVVVVAFSGRMFVRFAVWSQEPAPPRPRPVRYTLRHTILTPYVVRGVHGR